MREEARIAKRWRSENRRAVVARVVGTRGLGPRFDYQLGIVDADGTVAGDLLSGVCDAGLRTAARNVLADVNASTRIVEFRVDEADATLAGMTCGGEVDVFIQPLDAIPVELWEALDNGQAVAIAAAIDDRPARTALIFPGRRRVSTLGDAALDTLAESESEMLLAAPGINRARLKLGSTELLIESWNPLPRVLVLGENALADALLDQAGLLGWSTDIVSTLDDALATLDEMTPGDVVIVLDHHPGTATPVLAAALKAGIGYVGALGSRRTQVARRTHLENAGVTYVEMERLHGPAGLDIGGRTPAETALSIIAEVVANRTGRDAAPLRTTTGRINP